MKCDWNIKKIEKSVLRPSIANFHPLRSICNLIGNSIINIIKIPLAINSSNNNNNNNNNNTKSLINIASNKIINIINVLSTNLLLQRKRSQMWKLNHWIESNAPFNIYFRKFWSSTTLNLFYWTRIINCQIRLIFYSYSKSPL